MSRAPYKYLDYYTFEDADLFFGREEEAQRMVGEILSTRLLVLFSPSGSGKTSLINAGVRPQLENMGYQTIYTRLETEPISSVCNAVASALEIPCDGNVQSLYEFLKTVTSRTEKPLVIFLDQFEEFFTVFREQRDKRKEFIDQLAKIKYDDQLPVFVVLSLREDYFVNLHEFREAIPSIFQNNANLRLEPFTDEEARRAIVNPLRAKDIDASIDDALVNELIKDLKDSQPGIEPIKLQIVCHTLWEKKPEGAAQITLSDYQACAGADTILSRHVQDLLNKIPKRQHGFMVRIFEALITEEDTKRFRSFGELQKELKIKKPERLDKMLEKFSDLHLLRYEEKEQTKWYEFKHDYLVGEIIRWIQRRKEQLAKKRFRYAIAPGIVLALILLIWEVYEFNRFEARFTDQKYAQQEPEVIIKRKFNPFGFEVATGILYDELKSFEAWNDIKNGFVVSIAKKNEWSLLAENMEPVTSGISLCQIGDYNAGIDILLKALKNQDSNVRSRAAWALGKQSRADARVIDALLYSLKDKDGNVCSQAASALVTLGKTDNTIIDSLLHALKDQDWNVRYTTAWVLVNLGKTDTRVIDTLIVALKNQDLIVRSTAALLLAATDKSDSMVIDALLYAVRYHYGNVGSQAAWMLGKLGKADAAIIDALLYALNYQDWNIRSQAAWTLGTLGKVNARIIGELLNALKYQDENVRSQAAKALVKLGQSDAKVIASLLEALKDQNWHFRSQVIGILVKLSQADSKSIEALLATLKWQDWSVRSQVAMSLGTLGKADERIIDALLYALKDQISIVRFQAIGALSAMGKSDDKVINALQDMLKEHYLDWNLDLSYQAAWALVTLGETDTTVINTLRKALKLSYGNIRYQAAWALVTLGKTDTTVIDALLSLLKDPNGNIRAQSAGVLGKIGQADAIVTDALVEALKDQEGNVRNQAVWALVKLSQANTKVIDVLLEALKSQDGNVRFQVISTLALLGKADIRVVDALMAALKDQNGSVRSQAAGALGTLLKPKQKNELIEFLKAELSGLRTAGAQALARQDSISDGIWKEINRLKDKDKRPWVRLGAWEAYELIQKRLEDEKAANHFIHKADSLFQINKFWEAGNQYQSAFDQLTEIIRIDSLKIARTKFQKARCTAKMKRIIPTLDHLEIAFQYDKAWRDTLRAELEQKGSEWEFMKGNWYLKEVLLKK